MTLLSSKKPIMTLASISEEFIGLRKLHTAQELFNLVRSALNIRDRIPEREMKPKSAPRDTALETENKHGRPKWAAGTIERM